MSISKYVGENLFELKSIVNGLDDDQYKRNLPILSGASIGQHIRHILEFYAEVLKSDERICYDTRKRDKNIENNRLSGIGFIGELEKLISLLHEDRKIEMYANYSADHLVTLSFQSSLYRELAYALEHSVHHQAIIKIGLKEIGRNNLMSNTFGFSAATRRYKINGEPS